MSRVKVEPDYLVALETGVVEGVTCVSVACTDYDHFRKLPAAISHNGILCGKTGWNSDKHQAYYQSNATLVRIQ